MSITAKDIEAFLRSLAPKDFGDVPLYAMLESDGLPAELTMPNDDTCGWFCRATDLASREWLGERWCGRGPALALNDVLIRREVEAHGTPSNPLPREMADDIFRTWLFAVAVHETAHALGEPFDLKQRDAAYVAGATELIAAMCKAPAKEADTPFIGHDATFIKILAHLATRAEAAGVLLPDSQLFAHRNYKLSPLSAYRHALGSEPDDMAASGLSFAEIREAKPPRAFIAQWQSDLNAWAEPFRNRAAEVERTVARYSIILLSSPTETVDRPRSISRRPA
jgi:hypothetical protein